MKESPTNMMKTFIDKDYEEKNCFIKSIYNHENNYKSKNLKLSQNKDKFNSNNEKGSNSINSNYKNIFTIQNLDKNLD